MIPILETPRLILRAFDTSDFETFVPFYASEASRFVGGPDKRSATWRRMAGYAGCWQLRGYGKFVVEEKATKQAVGIVGPWFPEGWPEPEIGWTVLPEFQGRGYAFEASVRALMFAYDDLGWQTAMSAIFPDNHPSFRVAARLGAQREGSFELKPYGMLEVYRHLSPSEFHSHLGTLQ
jgi:RimJ/RimL family protein N-acetyltransferase